MKRVFLSFSTVLFLLFSCILSLVSISAQNKNVYVAINSAAQVDFLKPEELQNSNIIRVSIEYNIPPEEPIRYLNIMANFLLPPYELVWWGQNITLNPFENETTLICNLDIHKVGGLIGMEINELSFVYGISDIALLSYPDTSGWSYVTIEVNDFTCDIGNGIEITTDINPGLVTPFQHNWVLAADSNWIYRGCNVPNIDLDNSTYPFTIDPTTGHSYMGDINACALAACVNSIAWLETQHPEINSGLNSREKITMLDNMVNREGSTGGASIENLVEGTLDFIDSLELPISVKFQTVGLTSDINSPNPNYGHSADNQGANPANASGNQVSWDWIKSEMESGEDVTMVVSDWNGTGWGSHHAVTLTGISKDNNNKQVTFKDDANQGQPGGTSETQINVNEQNGWLVTNYPSSSGGNQIITAVISKSYDPNVSFQAVSIELKPSTYKNIQMSSYPNPFNSSTTIEFMLPEDGFIDLEIFSIDGKSIWSLKNKLYQAGWNKFVWNPQNTSSGVYLFRIKFNNSYSVLKILCLK